MAADGRRRAPAARETAPAVCPGRTRRSCGARLGGPPARGHRRVAPMALLSEMTASNARSSDPVSAARGYDPDCLGIVFCWGWWWSWCSMP